MMGLLKRQLSGLLCMIGVCAMKLTSTELVQTNMTLVSSERFVQTVGSTAQMTIVLQKTTFLVYWRYNGTDVALCSYNNGDANATTYILEPSQRPRMHTRQMFVSNGIEFELDIKKVDHSDDNITIDMKNNRGSTVLGSIKFRVSEGCDLTNSTAKPPNPATCGFKSQCPLNCSGQLVGGAEGVCGGDGVVYVSDEKCQEDCFSVSESPGIIPTIPNGCTLEQNCQFGCSDDGYVGNAIGVCTYDGSVSITEPCQNVTCDTSLAVPDTCLDGSISSSSVGYYQAVTIKCNNGLAVTNCTSLDGFDGVSEFFVSDVASLTQTIDLNTGNKVTVNASGYNFYVRWLTDGNKIATCSSDCKCGYEVENINASLTCKDNQYSLVLTILSPSTDDDGKIITLDINDEHSIGSWTLQFSGSSTPSLSMILLWLCICRWLAAEFFQNND